MLKEGINIMILLLLLFLAITQFSNADEPFDVRKHLATVTRYADSKDISANSFVSSEIPDQCTPIHLNLVARHGTRAPTKKKIRKLEALDAHLEVLVRDAKEHKQSLEKIPSWLAGWRSPWKGKVTGGELITEGEDELYHLGIRVRERFPDLFNEEYHPDVYSIKTTQVPRASASAVAFGMGLFNERGKLGPGRHRAFAVTSESRASDIVLRFHDCCQSYKAFRKSQEPNVDKLKEPLLNEITRELVRQYGLNFTNQDVSSLWFLCKQEASLLNITNQACSLFSPSEVSLLEWADDLELFILKGYGDTLNYRMGVPLLEDVVQSMELAIKAKEEGYATGISEKARMRFAHAETLLPFSCLIGLFLEESEFERIQREESLELPPKPPKNRNWRGSNVAPFSGNNMLILYSCQSDNSSKYFVQVLHNERPIALPSNFGKYIKAHEYFPVKQFVSGLPLDKNDGGCHGSSFCPFEIFKDKIAAPHLKHDYNMLCNVIEQKQKDYASSKLSQILGWFWSLRNAGSLARKDDL